MQKQTIFGPPGTGKTTTLLKILTDILRTNVPRETAFVSYTRKGTYEGALRAKEELKLSDRELIYFRTIHSICFNYFGLHKDGMVSRDHYRLFSQKTGLNCLGYYTADFSATDDEYLHVNSMYNHNLKLAERLASNLDAEKLDFIRYEYSNMKQQLGIIDFDDLLMMYLAKGKPLPVKVAFIDEAQDLTPLQWKVVNKMFKNAEFVTVAGDDDQCLYEFSGADVDLFLNFSDDHHVLHYSHRLPTEILKTADNVVSRIQNRKHKDTQPNTDIGLVGISPNLYKTKLEGGELILARTNYQLRKLADVLYHRGFVFELKGKSSIDRMMIKAISAYDKWQNGLCDKNELNRYKVFFTNIDRGLPWVSAVKLNDKMANYYESVINTNAMNLEPIRLETFHSIKGGEADHVIISTEFSKRVSDEMLINSDSELRCLYVAITRAKKSVIFLEAEGQHFYDPLLYTKRSASI